jgi:hypothetical protein
MGCDKQFPVYELRSITLRGFGGDLHCQYLPTGHYMFLRSGNTMFSLAALLCMGISLMSEVSWVGSKTRESPSC